MKPDGVLLTLTFYYIVMISELAFGINIGKLSMVKMTFICVKK